MDIQPQNQQPISDDQELAKVLAGVSQQNDAIITPLTTDITNDDQPEVEVETPELIIPEINNSFQPAPIEASTDLNAIKKDALSELRPLVDKLDVSPEEKFDTYLLLLRSTDDQTLIAPAHESARLIADEARRAQALLDIIKEIDYLSAPRQAA